MLARVLKSAQGSAPPSPSKSKDTKDIYTAMPVPSSAASGVPPSPSKIPRASTKENAAPAAAAPAPGAAGDRSSYLSFLWNQDKNPTSAAAATAAAPAAKHTAAYDDDVHMMTMKGSVTPAVLKAAEKVPPPLPARGDHHYHYQKAAHLGVPGAPTQRAYAEDVHMRTAKPEETQVAPRGLSLWERELLDSAEVKRKATVAQICES